MYTSIVILPLIGSMIAGFGGYRIGTIGSQYITTFSVTCSFIFSLITFNNIGLKGDRAHIIILNWIDSGMFECNWSIYLDSVTVVMLIVVTSISTCVHIYSIEYMRGDPHHSRFMSYLSLFTFFMLVLVTADNFIQLFVGWEGVGLCSYLLINFWYTRIEANKAAMKAIIVNRIGDYGLTLAMLALFYLYGAIDFATIFAITESLNAVQPTIELFENEISILNFIAIFLFIGAVGKSAQIGLHTWLPDAMEGPTPVSALIHAATMVTAGVFLLIRCSPLLEYAPDILVIITLVGALTAFFAATSGLVQFDLKKVVAYSTCSQLGYMVFACGLSCYSVSLFHLYNHAFFKALLFLSCGSVIHALHDEQDMRKMGGLISILPLTSVMFLIGSLALMGFPFLTGFYSKDVLIEVAYAKFSFDGTFAHWLGCLSAFFTAFYSIRLFYLTFISKPNGPKVSIELAHDAPPLMAIPLMILAIASMFIGYISKDLFIGLGTDFFQNAITILPSHLLYVDSEFLPVHIKLLPLVFTLAGASIGWVIYHFNINLIDRTLFTFLNQKWHWDNIYNAYVAKPILYAGYHHTFIAVDRGLVELLGPTGLVKMFSYISKKLSKLHTGYLFHYTFVFTLGVIFILSYSNLGAYENILTFITVNPFIPYLFVGVAIFLI
jgi:proton-translocating NADH-quinone oxidoreductase chain L